MPASALSAIPFLGSGLGYRQELKEEILAARDVIDFVEVIADQFIHHPDERQELAAVAEVFPVIPHGIGLSVGSALPLEENYLRAIKRVCDDVKAPYYSEHLCMTRAPGIDIGHLSPLWFTEGVLRSATENVSRVQDYLGKPLVLENVTYLFEIPGAGLSQEEFFHRLVEATGCGILLDLTNVHINSVNHRFDPVAFLERMPLDRIVQVHVAGGYWSDDVLVDGHSEPVQEETWRLLECLTALTQIKGSILEHDRNFPEDVGVLLAQVRRAREVIASARAAKPTPCPVPA